MMLTEILMQNTSVTVVSAQCPCKWPPSPVGKCQNHEGSERGTFDDEAGVRTLQCQFHKPQSLVAPGGETNYDGSRMTIIPICVATKIAQIVEIKDTSRLATDFVLNCTFS